MLKPHQVFDEIRRRRSASDDPQDPIRFHWVAVTPEDDGGDRDRFSRLLRELAGGYPLVPVVLRMRGFEDPNAVANDLAKVLEACRDDLRDARVRERMVGSGFVDFVLISRRSLALAATSSPLLLPDWFPVSPGQDVIARIEDLTWSVGIPLSAPEAHVGEIKRLLCELDRVLLRRARAVGQQDHRRVRGLLDRLQRSSGDTVSVEEFFSVAQAALNNVRNPREYRPSARSGTVVGRLWSLTARTHPDGLPRVARSLAQALQVGAGAPFQDHEESIVAVLGRPSNPIREAERRWAFDMIVTVRAACQLVTAAAHADEYARYPVRLLGSLSRELQRSLDGFVDVLGRE